MKWLISLFLVTNVAEAGIRLRNGTYRPQGNFCDAQVKMTANEKFIYLTFVNSDEATCIPSRKTRLFERISDGEYRERGSERPEVDVLILSDEDLMVFDTIYTFKNGFTGTEPNPKRFSSIGIVSDVDSAVVVCNGTSDFKIIQDAKYSVWDDGIYAAQVKANQSLRTQCLVFYSADVCSEASLRGTTLISQERTLFQTISGTEYCPSVRQNIPYSADIIQYRVKLELRLQ